MGNTIQYDGCGVNEAAKNWFAVFTVPRHEKQVEEYFRVRQIESFLPLIRMGRRWKDGSKGIVELPLFPSYTFVRIGCGGRVPVLSVPGVISIVVDGQIERGLLAGELRARLRSLVLGRQARTSKREARVQYS